MKLYQNKLSPNCKRVRVVANELGINVNIVDVDFTTGAHRKPEYLAKNPMGKVPTLEDDDGFVLWESNAILAYLASKNPQSHLFPTDAKNRAEVLRWLFWCSTHYEPAVYGVLAEKLIKPMMGAQPDPVRLEACTKDFQRFSPILDAHLKGKQWIVGETLSVADISLGVVTECAFPSGLDLSASPNVKGWLERLQGRDSWKKASA
jgi:glutathione S-transferase